MSDRLPPGTGLGLSDNRDVGLPGGGGRTKRMLFTGDLITGLEAKENGLVIDSVPEAQLDDRVQNLVDRIKGVPRNQLMMHELMMNQAYDNMGLASAQMMATLFDGITRHSPGGHGVQAACR